MKKAVPRIHAKAAKQDQAVAVAAPAPVSQDGGDTVILDSSAVALTAPGQSLAITSKELREVMCYLDSGLLLVSGSHRHSRDVVPHIRSLIAQIKRMEMPCKVEYTDLSTISKAYEQSGSKEAITKSRLQTQASDIFSSAVHRRASDIHIHARRSAGRTEIYMRVHGKKRFIEEHSHEFGNLLCTGIYQTMTDQSGAVFEEVGRQDARISDRKKLPPNVDGIRIATTPTTQGTLMVLRLLYDDIGVSPDLPGLGFDEFHVAAINLMKRRPYGLILISGPTGSGKSTTLKHVLESIYDETEGTKNILTVEDPAEYPIRGATQIYIKPSKTEEESRREFAGAIRTALRLDPDVLLIGEVRDRASAGLAIEASMTGHLVPTSVHANDALSSIDRLLDLGVSQNIVTDPKIIAGMISQRLVRVLCDHCKVPFLEAAKDECRIPPADVKRVMSSIHNVEHVHVSGGGCKHCTDGFVGREVVAEVVVTDHILMSFIRANDKIGAIDYWRTRQQGRSMLQHAITKIEQGRVDPIDAESDIGPLNAGQIEDDYSVSREEVVGVA